MKKVLSSIGFKIRKMKDNKIKFVPMRKIWKLSESSIRSNFKSYMKEFKQNSETVATVGY